MSWRLEKMMVGQRWRRGYNHFIELFDLLWLTHLYSEDGYCQDVRARSPARKAVPQSSSSFLCLLSNIPVVCDFSGGHINRNRKSESAMDVMCQWNPKSSLFYQTPPFVLQKLQGHFDIDYSKYERFNNNFSIGLKHDVKGNLFRLVLSTQRGLLLHVGKGQGQLYRTEDIWAGLWCWTGSICVNT